MAWSTISSSSARSRGQRAAIYASKLGKKVALVEMREVVGGACINTGTIPSKTMREAVLHLSGYNYKSIYGMNYRVKERITMADLAFRVQHSSRPNRRHRSPAPSQQRRDARRRSQLRRYQLRRAHVQVANSPRQTSSTARKNVLIATGTKPASSAKVAINGKPSSTPTSPRPRQPAQDPHRRRRRRHRRSSTLHVFGPRRPRHAYRARPRLLEFAGHRDHRSPQLPLARLPRNHAHERRKSRASKRCPTAP